MKTIRNIWVTLSSFFSWKKMEFQIENPVKNILAPKFPKTVTEPYTQDEFERMIKACTYSREAETVRRKRFVMRRPTANRDRAIILALLDTGIRASEFCALKVGNFDAKTGRLEIRQGETGGAKGGKGRIVYLGKTARHVVWRYLADREDGDDAMTPLFIASQNHVFTPNNLRHLVKRIAARCDVKNVYPHRFRHTFGRSFGRLVNASIDAIC